MLDSNPNIGQPSQTRERIRTRPEIAQVSRIGKLERNQSSR